jgi:hypothetical protein
MSLLPCNCNYSVKSQAPEWGVEWARFKTHEIDERTENAKKTSFHAWSLNIQDQKTSKTARITIYGFVAGFFESLVKLPPQGQGRLKGLH